jgi:hypothetical protein
MPNLAPVCNYLDDCGGTCLSRFDYAPCPACKRQGVRNLEENAPDWWRILNKYRKATSATTEDDEYGRGGQYGSDMAIAASDDAPDPHGYRRARRITPGPSGFKPGLPRPQPPQMQRPQMQKQPMRKPPAQRPDAAQAGEYQNQHYGDQSFTRADGADNHNMPRRQPKQRRPIPIHPSNRQELRSMRRPTYNLEDEVQASQYGDRAARATEAALQGEDDPELHRQAAQANGVARDFHAAAAEGYGDNTLEGRELQSTHTAAALGHHMMAQHHLNAAVALEQGKEPPEMPTYNRLRPERNLDMVPPSTALPVRRSHALVRNVVQSDGNEEMVAPKLDFKEVAREQRRAERGTLGGRKLYMAPGDEGEDDDDDDEETSRINQRRLGLLPQDYYR